VYRASFVIREVGEALNLSVRRSLEKLVSPEEIGSRILVVRGQKVLLDVDLARLYAVTSKRLNEQVRRNALRFPSDFVFQLKDQELRNLRSQIATSSLPSRSWGGRRYARTPSPSMEL
jgi:hypothetical protein